MKKLMKKYVALLLGVVLMATGTLTKTAYASSSAGFDVYSIQDAARMSGDIDIHSYSNNQSVYSGGSYSINTLDFSVNCRYYRTMGDISVFIDGQFSETAEMGANKPFISGDYYNVHALIRYLSPGKHKIEVMGNQSDPDSRFNTIQIKRVLYVTVPAYEDEYIKKSLANINNGTATINDYKIVAVNPKKITDLSALNKKVQGKNLTISNVQSTVYGLV